MRHQLLLAKVFLGKTVIKRLQLLNNKPRFVDLGDESTEFVLQFNRRHDDWQIACLSGVNSDTRLTMSVFSRSLQHCGLINNVHGKRGQHFRFISFIIHAVSFMNGWGAKIRNEARP